MNTTTIYMDVPSTSNLREHWRTRAKRVKVQREAALISMLSVDMREALLEARRWAGTEAVRHVSLVRLSPRKLDDDNLRGALKAVRDGVADALGVDDAHPSIVWHYGQAQDKRKGVRISLHTVKP